uniref:Uncharacterized protein n=1 Tax=Mycena chlorophos TaxID=658473 RepID=A0ABQ0L9A9_MYCCL|nr:predicted protein [Mycena chlorophos]
MPRNNLSKAIYMMLNTPLVDESKPDAYRDVPMQDMSSAPSSRSSSGFLVTPASSPPTSQPGSKIISPVQQAKP